MMNLLVDQYQVSQELLVLHDRSIVANTESSQDLDIFSADINLNKQSNYIIDGFGRYLLVEYLIVVVN